MSVGVTVGAGVAVSAGVGVGAGGWPWVCGRVTTMIAMSTRHATIPASSAARNVDSDERDGAVETAIEGRPLRIALRRG